MTLTDIISVGFIFTFIVVVIVHYFNVRKKRSVKATEDYDHFHRIDIGSGFILLRGNEVERFKKESKAIQTKMVHAQQKLIQSGQVKLAKYKGKLWLVGPLEYERMKKDGVLENLSETVLHKVDGAKRN